MLPMRLSWQEFSTPWATYYVLQLDFLGKLGSRQPSIVTGGPHVLFLLQRGAKVLEFLRKRRSLSKLAAA